jgi:hypothetical protein
MLIESSDGDGSVVVVEIPPDFHQVPLDDEVESRTAAQLRLLDDMGLSDPRQREALSLYLEALSIRLGDSDDLVSTAFCAVDLGGHASTATITVAVHETHTTDPGLAVLGAAEAMRRDGRLGTVEIVELGHRPVATARVERRAVPGQPDSPGETLRELSIFVPVPRRELAAMVVLSTPCLSDWDVYERLAFDVSRSLHVRGVQAAGS